MRVILGLLLGYSIRGNKRLLIATLTVIVVVGFIVLPAIVLSQLPYQLGANDSRPPQTSVPMVVGLNYKTAQIKLRDANLNRSVALIYPTRVEYRTINCWSDMSFVCAD
jgi:hypothetical protein